MVYCLNCHEKLLSVQILCRSVIVLFSDLPGTILGATELQGPAIYSYKALKTATNNFSEENKLGEGGFGEVYKVVYYIPFVLKALSACFTLFQCNKRSNNLETEGVSNLSRVSLLRSFLS